MRSPVWFAALLSVICFAAASPATAGLNVVVTIKPVHALVRQVMHGVAEPTLLVKGSSSPHTYAMSPTDARALNHAAVFFRMGPAIEPFTQRLIGALPKDVEVVTLIDTPGLSLLAARGGPTFDRNDAHPTHDAGAIDGHAWLDPVNAQAMVERIARVLSRHDSANAAVYSANANALKRKLRDLETELADRLRPVAGRPYILFHDALQYFERRFGLNAIGSIAISPEIPPSGKRLLELRQRIKVGGAVCVFAEPQFGASLVRTVVEGTGARVGTLDPEATILTPSPRLYFTLMRSLATELVHCLSTPA